MVRVSLRARPGPESDVVEPVLADNVISGTFTDNDRHLHSYTVRLAVGILYIDVVFCVFFHRLSKINTLVFHCILFQTHVRRITKKTGVEVMARDRQYCSCSSVLENDLRMNFNAHYFCFIKNNFIMPAAARVK